MDDISNRTLAVFLITAIVVSLGATLGVLNKLSSGPTGRATTDQGNVSLRVATEASIILNQAIVDFGSGFVNNTNPGCTNNATLEAAAAYADSGGTDCWTATETPTSLLLENDGNVNVTLDVTGPNVIQFFTHSVEGAYADYSSNDFEYNLSWKVRDDEAGACNEVGDAGAASSYRPFTGSSQNVCDNLDYYVAAGPDGQDEIAIDVEVKIPSDLYPGLYENTSIVFSAAAAS